MKVPREGSVKGKEYIVYLLYYTGICSLNNYSRGVQKLMTLRVIKSNK